MSEREIIVEGIVEFATFHDRPNRFLVNLRPESSGKLEPAFLHDPGRMKELLLPNVSLVIRKPIRTTERKTKWDILAVEHENRLVTINSRLPNIVSNEALNNGWIKKLADYETIRPEIPYGKSRLDFLLTNESEKCYVEVKGVTLVQESTALFPDAPTERGARHLRELIKLKKEGHRAVILFVCMRDDPIAFTPNVITDPKFSEQLIEAANNDVEILVYKVKPLIRNNRLILQFKEKIKVKL